MKISRWMALGLVLGLGLWGCATGGTTTVTEAPPVKQPVYYYVGGLNVNLKSTPDSHGKDTGRLTVNERVEMVKRSASWFLVQAPDGSQGWVSEQYLSLQPVTDFYVRRWGRLRSAPESRSKSLARIRVNEQVKLLETNQSGWARVTVARTGKTGWIETDNLSTRKVAVRRYRRPSKGTAKTGSAEEGAATAGEAPASKVTPSGPGPKAAEAAETPPAKPAPAKPKARPEMFDAF
ncbi:MAG TPA: SH3 domain-containing protein [Desulfobaccales bacterium]|nr:SH3 domain-containing protein [Desulfobaccales bacterium]